jgi:hypothetical protein
MLFSSLSGWLIMLGAMVYFFKWWYSGRCCKCIPISRLEVLYLLFIRFGIITYITRSKYRLYYNFNVFFSDYTGAGSVVSVGGFDYKEQVQPQSNMVLRKRIRRIRQGMKKYNDQLVEVKRDLKGCKTKMEAQTKQVHEYSSRLEEYDKKFEENARKFQTLLTVSTV